MNKLDDVVKRGSTNLVMSQWLQQIRHCDLNAAQQFELMINAISLPRFMVIRYTSRGRIDKNMPVRQIVLINFLGDHDDANLPVSLRFTSDWAWTLDVQKQVYTCIKDRYGGRKKQMYSKEFWEMINAVREL